MFSLSFCKNNDASYAVLFLLTTVFWEKFFFFLSTYTVSLMVNYLFVLISYTVIPMFITVHNMLLFWQFLGLTCSEGKNVKYISKEPFY